MKCPKSEEFSEINPFGARTENSNESCVGCEQVVHSIAPCRLPLVIWSAHRIEYELLASVDSAQNDRLVTSGAYLPLHKLEATCGHI